ncbi:uncharacterized protein EDB93DRAFT_1265784 [Suillus bovinus]|uniref:uncharacterized protein n=1 Tax=Suillus bovinus TaxID=48563 RepID=UPI001B87EE52|nr:uncharacterized protein EDB93DRAFT_1265784 [Suillus bovinus]KAG2129408.1 hypothetical protein EDB93DRAFT_1265784 [Suillus bovinus]
MNKCHAIEVVHKVAAYNGKTSNLTLEDLQRAGKLTETTIDDGVRIDTSALAAVQRKMKMGMFSNNHVKSLFATRKMAWSTTILIIIWAFIGRCTHSAKRWLEVCTKVVEATLISEDWRSLAD